MKFINKQQQIVPVYFRMMPSNAALSKNLENLLHRYQLQHNKSSSSPYSVFIKPSSQQKSSIITSIYNPNKQILNVDPKQSIIEGRIRLINNYSFKRVRTIERKRRKSSQSTNDNPNYKVNRYNMSVDSTIQLPAPESNQHSISKDSSIQSKNNERLFRRKGNTQYMIKNMHIKNKLNDMSNEQIDFNENFQFDTNNKNNERKTYETRKKNLIHTKVSITRKASPRDQHLALNFCSLNNSIRIPYKSVKEHKKSFEQLPNQIRIKTIKSQNNQSQKQNNIDAHTIIAISPRQIKRKDKTRGGNCKQLFFNRVLKSKTQILKKQDQKICPWGRLPESILQESPSLMHKDQQSEF